MNGLRRKQREDVLDRRFNEAWYSALSHGLHREYSQQIRPLVPFLVRLYLPVLLGLGGIAWIGLWSGTPIGTFTRDPATVIGFSPFVGLVSNLGILLWSATAAIALFSAAVLRKQKPEMASFYLFTGLVTAMLLFDDWFLFHEVVFPHYLLIPEKVLFAVYIVILSVYLLRFSRSIAQTEYAILLLAVAFIGASTLWDLVLPLLQIAVPGHAFFEDGLKMCGIVAWAAYFIRSSFHSIHRYS